MTVVDKAWDGSPGRFTDSQYESSCVLDRKVCGGDWKTKPPKQRCSLPIKEPNGDLNKNAISAAEGRLDQVKDACPAAVSAAESALASARKQAGMPAKNDKPDADDKKDKKKSADDMPRHRERALAASEGEWQLRAADDTSPDGCIGVLTGHFAVFNRWTEIDSFFEGRFMESIAPGAFTKTFKENRQGMRCLFQHGRDPQVGMKVLGPIRELEQDDQGARYDVDFMDTTYNRDLEPGLRSGQYGASFRFQVIREEIDNEPKRSSHNPEGIPERVITEAKVREFGPVTFGAYDDATAGLRSMNDDLLELDLRLLAGADPERLATFLNHLRGGEDGNGNGNASSNVDTNDDAGTRESGTTQTSPEAVEEDRRRLRESREANSSETAPPSEAPGGLMTRRRAPTLRPGAARRLQTSRTTEEKPKWKL